MHLLSTAYDDFEQKARKQKLALNMPVWFVLICGIVLERKKLPEIGKVAEHLVDSLTRHQEPKKRCKTGSAWHG